MPRATPTAKERKAADAHIAGATHLDAYLSAYSCRSSRAIARQRAYEVFSRPRVQQYIERQMDKAADASVLAKREAMQILTGIARGQVSRYITDSGEIDTALLAQAGPELESVRVSEGMSGQQITAKFRDPVRAIERLAKMLDWDEPERHDLGGVTFHLDMGGGTGGQTE